MLDGETLGVPPAEKCCYRRASWRAGSTLDQYGPVCRPRRAPHRETSQVMSEPNWDYIQACIRFCELEDKILWATCKAARCEETGTFGFRHRVGQLEGEILDPHRGPQGEKILWA